MMRVVEDGRATRIAKHYKSGLLRGLDGAAGGVPDPKLPHYSPSPPGASSARNISGF